LFAGHPQPFTVCHYAHRLLLVQAMSRKIARPVAPHGAAQRRAPQQRATTPAA